MSELETILKELSEIRLYRSYSKQGPIIKDAGKVYDLVIQARRYFIDESSLKIDKNAAKVRD